MLRYYTTLGLLDRPVEVRGRVAYYGRRHLLQVVAVKRLQAAGASLAEVQRRLAGASTADLEAIAALPAATSDGPPPTDRAATDRVRRRFWHSPSAAAGAVDDATTAPAPVDAGHPAVPPVPAAIRLAPGVTLVVDAARPLSPADHEAVRAAARGLVDHLSPLLKEPE